MNNRRVRAEASNAQKETGNSPKPTFFQKLNNTRLAAVVTLAAAVSLGLGSCDCKGKEEKQHEGMKRAVAQAEAEKTILSSS